jgi:hypothetical protein
MMEAEVEGSGNVVEREASGHRDPSAIRAKTRRRNGEQDSPRVFGDERVPQLVTVEMQAFGEPNHDVPRNPAAIGEDAAQGRVMEADKPGERAKRIARVSLLSPTQLASEMMSDVHVGRYESPVRRSTTAVRKVVPTCRPVQRKPSTA